MYLLEMRYCNCNIIVLMARRDYCGTNSFIYTYFSAGKEARGFSPGFYGKRAVHTDAFYYRLEGTLSATIVIFCENTI